LQALLPHDLSMFRTLVELTAARRKKKLIQKVGAAALLAVMTALGVFGLAALLHLALSWVA
jgi:hypothetical protein